MHFPFSLCYNTIAVGACPLARGCWIKIKQSLFPP
nr:MAG TPA: hypothetical protein [Podoviridae sp. ctJ6o53]